MKTEEQYHEIIDQHLAITAAGYGIDESHMYLPCDEYKAIWESERKALFTFYPQYCHCMDYLATKRYLNRDRTTYALKQDVEKWLIAKGVPDHYIPQGSFILAALTLGYRINKVILGCPNVTLRR